MALIPGKNPLAMLAYYLGIFSLMPCIGAPLGLGAIICGFIGFAHAAQRPEIEGKGHAVAGVILGLIGPIAWIGIFYLLWRG